MDINVTLSDNWNDVVFRLQRFDSADLRREYGKAVREGAKGAPAAVRAAVPQYMPSGYAPVLAPALRFTVKPNPGGVTITARGRGKGHPREIGRMEAGVLRAPNYPRGRRANWTWHNQAIRPGFFSKPITKLEPQIREAVRKAMQRIADKIVKG